MRSLTLAIVVGLFMALAGSAHGAPSVTGIFDLPEEANRIALGPDGNLWVTLNAASPNIARVAPDGTVAPFTAPGLTFFPVGITAGPDGQMWLTGTNKIGRFSPTDPAAATEDQVNAIGEANDITVGPDGNLWTGSDTNVIRVTPTSPPVATSFPSTVTGFDARGITSSTDGKLWIASGGSDPGIGILPMAVDGTPGTFVQITDPTAKVMDVAAGPNGQIAYTQPVGDVQQLGLINGGAISTTTPTPGKDPTGITLGQDGAYWTAQFNSASVGRYTTDGQYSELAGLPVGGRRITKGPGNTLWVMYDLATGKKVARISGIENPDVLAPTITSLKLTNTKFRVGTRNTALVAKAKKKKAPRGTTISYTLSEMATASIAVQKATAGRRSGTLCVKPTAKLKKAKAKKCTRYVVIKTLTRLQLAGANKVAFSGRIGKTKLKVGKYRFLITAQDAKGNISQPVKKSFRIVK